MCIAVFFFSLMNLSVKLVTLSIPTYELVFFRSFVSLLIVYTLMFQKKLSPFGNDRFFLILRGVAGTLALFFYFYSLGKIPLATAVTLQSLSPVFTTLIAISFFKERPPQGIWIFYFISFVGVVVLKGWDVGGVSTYNLLIALASAACSGLAYNVVRGLRRDDHPLVISSWLPLIGTLAFAPYALFHFVWPTYFEWTFLILSGVFAQIAQIFMTEAYLLEETSKVSQMNFLSPVVALIYGALFFGEWISLQGLLGLSLILFGVICATKVKQKKKSYDE